MTDYELGRLYRPINPLTVPQRSITVYPVTDGNKDKSV